MFTTSPLLDSFILFVLFIVVCNVLLYLIQWIFGIYFMYFMSRMVRILHWRRKDDSEIPWDPSADSGALPISLRALRTGKCP